MSDLRPYQKTAKENVLKAFDEGQKRTLLVLSTGCHKKGQKLLMADGTAKKVEDIKLFDELLGDDGTKRTVLKLHHGIAPLFKIIPIKGEPFIVNGEHKLSLVCTNLSTKQKPGQKNYSGKKVDVTVNDWLKWSDYDKRLYKLYRSEKIERFEKSTDDLEIDPYFLGVYLGDGSFLNYRLSITTQDEEIVDELKRQAEKYNMHLKTAPAGKAETYFFVMNKPSWHNTLRDELKRLGLHDKKSGEKFVPKEYRNSTLKNRLEILAGLLDTDGSLSKGSFDFISKSKRLSEDVAFLSRSVGLAAYVKECTKGCKDFKGQYFRVCISGDCSIIPIRVKRKKASKRLQKKSVLRTGFIVRPVGCGEYFGFTVDKNNRYLLDDFTVTHNCGKTIIFSSVIKHFVEQNKKCLVLAHRNELLTQGQEKLKDFFGVSSFILGKEEKNGNVCISSIQTLSNEKRLFSFPKNYFDLIVVDEAHHALSETYQKVLQYFESSKVLGVTATPDRGDKKKLSTFFESIAFEYSMDKAIKDGYLCPIKALMLPLKIDISDVKMSGGDFSADDVGHSLEPYLKQIAELIKENAKGRRTVIFLPLIKTSQKMCEYLRNLGLKAEEVNGESQNRKEILKGFLDGDFDFLCNSMLLTEGWDCPPCDCVVMLRPTKIRSLYTQVIGRGTRLSPGKKDLLLLDFLWNTERLDLLHPSNLFCDDAKLARRIDQKTLLSDEAINLGEALEEAKKDALREREDALKKELLKLRQRKKKLVDPLQYVFSIEDDDLASFEPTFLWENAPPTEKQLNYLEKNGINSQSVKNQGYASMLIDKLIKRKQMGLSTPKQIRFLERYGFLKVGTWSFEKANKYISIISKNNWMVPYYIDIRKV